LLLPEDRAASWQDKEAAFFAPFCHSARLKIMGEMMSRDALQNPSQAMGFAVRPGPENFTLGRN
jgi:hypothetical protein